MSLALDHREKIDRALAQDPHVTIFLRPIAAPAALGLAGFAGSTWITASWIARWWGDANSPTIFFPFVTFWGGLAQFIAAFFGFPARDTLVTVVHALWGSFWMSIGLLYMLVATGTLPSHPIDEHFPELAAWMIVLTFFTWSAALASIARDIILFGILSTLACGSTIACCLFAYDGGLSKGMKAAAYFWIVSAVLAWWRVTVYLVEEAFGHSKMTKLFPIFRTPMERRRPVLIPGFGEPGVRSGAPNVM